METDRMTGALALADKCWGKASKLHPEFVQRYLELAEKLLTTKQRVLGDEFKEYCGKNLLFRPLRYTQTSGCPVFARCKPLGGWHTTDTQRPLSRIIICRPCRFGGA